jgi:hypothetical protein
MRKALCMTFAQLVPIRRAGDTPALLFESEIYESRV